MKIHTMSQALLSGAGLVLLSGCASLIHGTRQTIPVASVPPEAKVYVQNVYVATTPGKIEVRRKDEGVTLRLEKDGYKPVEIRLGRTVSGAVFGNLALGGIIGLIVDFSNGAAYKQTPSQISASLLQAGATSADLTLTKNRNGILVVFRERLPGETPTGARISVE
jgi:hypothetical protein